VRFDQMLYLNLVRLSHFLIRCCTFMLFFALNLLSDFLLFGSYYLHSSFMNFFSYQNVPSSNYLKILFTSFWVIHTMQKIDYYFLSKYLQTKTDQIIYFHRIKENYYLLEIEFFQIDRIFIE